MTWKKLCIINKIAYLVELPWIFWDSILKRNKKKLDELEGLHIEFKERENVHGDVQKANDEHQASTDAATLEYLSECHR